MTDLIIASLINGLVGSVGATIAIFLFHLWKGS